MAVCWEMTMNKKLVEQMKRQNALVKKNIEEIYSGMCVVLHNRNIPDDDIAEIVQEVQAMWKTVANTPGANMCDICEELTGIDIREVS